MSDYHLRLKGEAMGSWVPDNSFAVGYFRIRMREGTKCQRLHELSLRDRRRVSAFASGSWTEFQKAPE